MHHAILEELKLRSGYLNDETINTIYFGGGTPSLFSGKQIEEILNLINSHFEASQFAEITLEANPDDLTKSILQSLKKVGINRLSIGVQTFDDDRLSFMNRAHSANEARESIKLAFETGFTNMTADLIYAIPPENMGYWEKDLSEMIALGLPHISLYGLTIEEKTVFGNWLAKGKLHETSEDIAARQYRYAIETLTEAGYEHYEVSNFAKPGFRSKHNSAYWSGEKYLGVGPGAHSYDGNTRSYNVRNNTKYINEIEKGVLPETIEYLSKIQRINEYVLTHLRTAKGIDLTEVRSKFEVDLKKDSKQVLSNYLNQGLIVWEGDQIRLTIDGFMVADEIALGLFYDEE